MNRPWGQQVSAAPPWRRAALFAALSDGVQIGGAATVGSMPGSLLQVAMLHQIMKRPLHRGAGQLHVRSNGVDTRPALALGIGAIPQVHINCLSPRGKFGVCINGSKVTHISSSPNAFVRLDFLLTQFGSRLHPAPRTCWMGGGSVPDPHGWHMPPLDWLAPARCMALQM